MVREMVAKPAEAPVITGTAMFLRLALTPLFLAAIAVYAYLANFDGEQRLILYLIAVATAINLLIEPIQSAFQARERMGYVALSSVISQSSMGIVGIALVLVGIKAVGIATSSLVVAIVALLCNLRWARGRAPIDHHITKARLRSLAKGSFPYMAIGLALLIYTWIDAVILSVLAPAQVVGWYGVCTRLFAALLFVPSILGTAWFPKLVGAFERNPDDLWVVARPNIELVAVLGIAVAVATAIGASPMIHLMYGPAYDKAVPVMVILACCIPMMYLGIAFGQVLVAAGRPTTLTIFLVAGGIANSALNVLLVPVFQRHLDNGAIGSAVSFVATELLITSAGFMVVGRHVLTRASWARVARTTVAAVAMFGVAYALRGYGVFALAPAGLTFIAAAFLLGIPTAEERAVLATAGASVRRRLSRRCQEHRRLGTRHRRRSCLVTRRHYVFVIEQGLGHVVHGMNIERVLATRDDIDGTVVKLTPGATEGVRPLPLIHNWSVQASWAARSVLRRHIASRRPDAIFVHTQVAALMLRSIMRRVPTVVSLDATPINFDTMADAYRHEYRPGPAERIKLAVNRRALVPARAVVTWSPWAATSVIDDYGVPAGRVHAIYPGVDVANFRPREGERRPGPVRILFVGGDFERKGGPDLLAAVAGLDTAVELDIVSVEPTITVPANTSVRVHSSVGANSTSMTELYRDADIFALPTLGDCTPLAIAEALASGLPVVASTVGSIPDMIRDGQNGLLVPAGDPRRLGEALARLVGEPELRESMGLRSRELAEQEHDSDANCRRLFELMDRIAADGPGGNPSTRARSHDG